MSDLRRVLVFSRFFPPMYDVGGKRAFRFSRYLAAFGWSPVVVTAAPSPKQRLDDEDDFQLPEHVDVVKQYYPSFVDFYQSAGTDATNTGWVKKKTYPPEGFVENLKWNVRWPIAPDIWNAPRMYALARSLAKRYRPEAIFATSSPYSALVFGDIAKRATNLPLCLDLRDPWSLNFLEATRPPWARKVDRWAEHALMARADRVTFTCRTAANAYRDLYPDLPPSKFAHIYNSFDPAHAPRRKETREGPIRLVHFGNCYGERTLGTVIQAVASLHQQQLISPDTLKLVNFGRCSEEDMTLAAELGAAPYIEHKGAISYKEGIEYLATADIQILLAYGDQDLFIPAKFFDYLLSGAPILCISRKSELTDLIEQTGSGFWATGEEVARVTDVIVSAIKARQNGFSLIQPDDNAIQSFSAVETARQLAEILDEMCAKN